MRPAEAGFTLLEMLVALAVFSLSVLALLNLSGEHARAAVEIESRALASVVAENRAVEGLTATDPPALGVAEGEEVAGGRTWRWRREVTATEDADVRRIDVKVGEAGSERTIAVVSVFRVAS